MYIMYMKSKLALKTNWRIETKVENIAIRIA